MFCIKIHNINCVEITKCFLQIKNVGLSNMLDRIAMKEIVGRAIQ